MSIRKFGALVGVVCATALMAPVAASAATTPAGIKTTSLASVPLSGASASKKTFTGHFNVDRFVAKNGKTYAVGTLTGKLGSSKVDKTNVAIPTKVQKSTTSSSSMDPRAASCSVLHLVLGPVNLNLLGLVVTLGGGTLANQPIVLDITAVPGAGNLLGNLLCDVSNLLNGSGTTALTPSLTAGLLNLVNNLLGTPALASL